ncbi:Ribonuclease P protein subunit p25-like protein [Sciurus carolinensis]|uniref:Ribonuclease P protein subunit p25-like protein n=1 Tax=Sciurus carolinensis TaxID=30640 RepID=A0AA41T0M1_SCICA|nr:Ribonuclease P protein subunit p25-like protein [Sciurus carolinensis]
MEHSRKAGSVELPAPSPVPQLPPDTLEVRVRDGSKIRNLLGLATENSWVPNSPDTGLDSLTVRLNVPAVWVLLSRDPLDPSECGYQPPGAPPGLGSMPSSSCGPRPRRRPRDTQS